MAMPGNVPNFSVDLVDFDHLEPYYVKRPPGASQVWDKLDELERRLHAFDWASMVVRQPRQCVTLINDLAFAFVFGFEATIQVLKLVRPRPRFDAWLRSLAAYDLSCRGIQTLRNLEAHIQSGQLRASHGNGVFTRFNSGMTPQPTVAWKFPEISPNEYAALENRGRKLAAHELSDWNQRVESEFAINIMRDALISLVGIVQQA